MECPDCAAANPLLKEASEKYHIPWVRHDFPLPFHPWSFQAAVNARWFDLKSKKLGDEYRDDIFANQPSFGEDPARMEDLPRNGPPSTESLFRSMWIRRVNWPPR